MLRAVILADDLSGAADCGVAFTAAGWSTLLSMDGFIREPNAQVLSIDADTRRLEAAAAAARVRKLVLALAGSQDLLVYKKIDSTLRGHVGIELAAALEAWRSVRESAQRPIALCAPAFPAAGRTTLDGMQWLHGKLLHETELWRLHGLKHAASIPEMMQAAGLRTALIPLRTIRAGAAFHQALRTREIDVLVCDAEDQEDLHAIAAAAMEFSRDTILAGSAGLARALPDALGLDRRTTAPVVFRVKGPILFAVGSLSRRSIEQMQTLLHASSTVSITVPPDVLLSGAASMVWRASARRLQQALERQEDVVLSPATDVQIEAVDRPLLTASLARMAASASDRVAAFVGTGGETARSVLARWGVNTLRLLGEVEAGVPVSVTEGWNRPLPVITKAGDFGSEATLLRCAKYLRGEAL